MELHPRKGARYELPDVSLLTEASKKSRKSQINEASLSQNARLLESVLSDFGVNGEIVKVRPGPVVTLYELEPSPGTKSSRVIGLADDIARSMSAVSARIATVTGRNVIGIELPNQTRETVYLRELLEDESFSNTSDAKPAVGAWARILAAGRSSLTWRACRILLVAGTTGSGKSVAINTMITSLIYRLTPDRMQIHHDRSEDAGALRVRQYPAPALAGGDRAGKAVVALKWTVKEMENRYRLMSSLGVRNIDGYNKRIREAKAKGEKLTRSVQTGFNPDTGEPIIEEVALDMTPLPFIVVVVDEMADLMLVAGKDIEGPPSSAWRRWRAPPVSTSSWRRSGRRLTSSPAVIKANFPTRVSFQVTSRIDSRTILNEQGAETIAGAGRHALHGGRRAHHPRARPVHQ